MNNASSGRSGNGMDEVICLADTGTDVVDKLLGRYALQLMHVADGQEIIGSFWGEPEAGISGSRVYARDDTPLHSLLHETAHIICMPAARRTLLHRDAGGDELEEAAVCYLQVLLADHIGGLGRERIMRDMDAWGYSFRLGSTARWFDADAADALAFLEAHALVTREPAPTWSLRQ